MAAVGRLVIEAAAAEAAVVAVIARQAQIKDRQHADIRAGGAAGFVEKRPCPISVPAPNLQMSEAVFLIEAHSVHMTRASTKTRRF